MTNHIHLIVSKNDNEKLPTLIRDFKKFNSIKLIEAIQSSNESRHEWMQKIFAEEAGKIRRVKYFKLWQDGNHQVQLDTNQMLDERLEYIHQNPV